MKIRFEVEVELTRTEGKFASKDELAGQIQSALEDANPGEVEGENGGQYEVSSFDVSVL